MASALAQAKEALRYAQPDKARHAIELPERTDFHMTLVGVTPEIATAWLTRNRGNRAIIPQKIAQYRMDMERGEWKEAGDPIRFSKTGRLLDGQNRLQALVASGVTKIPFVVIVGLDDEVFDTLDSGKPRGAADVLSIEGLGQWQARVAGTATHWILNRAAGRPFFSNIKSTNHAVRSFLLDNPKFAKTVDFVEALPRLNPPISHSLAAALHWEFRKIDPELADAFVTGLFVGVDLRRDSPVLTLRNKLKDSRLLAQSGSRTASGFSIKEQMHACIKAWNIMRRGKSCTSARTLFPRSDEDFPEIE